MNAQLRDFLLRNLDFAIEYISLHYPFTEEEVNKYLPYLIKGSAFYSEIVPELGTIIAPTIGLSFNQNVQWTLGLKRLWKVGYEIVTPACSSESGGYYDAETGQTIVWGSTTNENLFDIIPLDSQKEHVDNYYLHAVASGWELPYADREAYNVYGKLTAQKLIDLYNRFPSQVLYNDSIWKSTLAEAVTPDVMKDLLQAKRQQVEQDNTSGVENANAPNPDTVRYIEFPDINTYMEQMSSGHNEAPCHAAFKLYEYLFADSNAGDNETLNTLAEIWETSPKEIAQHMPCVHVFLEKSYPDVLKAMPTSSKQETAYTEEGDEDDHFEREQYQKYNGYNEWPDEAIDEAFEGDPEATWNVD